MVANAMAERCKESAFVDKESRFFTMVFFLDLVLSTPLYIGRYYFLKASKLDRVITGADHLDHFWFDIREAPHI